MSLLNKASLLSLCGYFAVMQCGLIFCNPQYYRVYTEYVRVNEYIEADNKQPPYVHVTPTFAKGTTA